MSTTPQAYRVGRHTLEPSNYAFDGDARGVVWCWEPPHATANYVIAVDPSLGITGWDRTLRTQDDVKTDNAAIQVLRCGPPDVQVAEYAAPIDPEDLAGVVNTLGRVYSGRHEDSQALVIIEVYPGMGLVTQRELISRYGYTNLFVWRYEDSFVSKRSSKLGWFSTRESRKMLWSRGSRHIHQNKCVIRSPWLVEEMADCTPDNFLAMTGRAGYGAHDDRVVAFLLAIWAANEWSMSIEPTEKANAEQVNAPSWQASDITAADMMTEWEDRFSSLVGDD